MPTPPPSDDELDQLWIEQFTGMMLKLNVRRFARLVLQKWGASSASIEEKRAAYEKGARTWVACHPACQSYDDIHADALRAYPLPAPRPREVRAPSGGRYRWKNATLELWWTEQSGGEWRPGVSYLPDSDRLTVAALLAHPTEDT